MRCKNENLLNEIVKYVDEYCSKYGRGPSTTIVAKEFNLSRASGYNSLSYLEKHNRLVKDCGNTYVSKSLARISDTVEVPLLGYIPCGPLEEVFEQSEGFVRLPKEMVGKGEYFLIRANGDSMINADINDGDLILIKKSSSAEVGNIVVALVENQITLKRLKYDSLKQVYYLHPENSELEDIYIDSLAIQGIAKKVISIKDII